MPEDQRRGVCWWQGSLAWDLPVLHAGIWLHFSSWPGSSLSAGPGAWWTRQLKVVAPKLQGCGARCCPCPGLASGDWRSQDLFLSHTSFLWGCWGTALSCTIGCGSEVTVRPRKCKGVGKAVFLQHRSRPAGRVSEKGGSALLKCVLEALSGQTLASGPRQGGPGFQGEGICSPL